MKRHDPKSRKRNRQAWLTALAAGSLHAILFVLAFPPYNLWPLTFLAILPLAVAAIKVRSRGRLFLAIWFTSTIAYLIIQWWMREVTALGYPLLCIYLGFYPALFTYLFSKLRSYQINNAKSRIPSVILVPILWTGIEFFRGDFFMEGYPWFLIGHPAIGWPVLCQSADLFGTYFISFLTATTTGLFIDILIASQIHNKKYSRSLLKTSITFFLIVQLGNLAYGIYQQKNTPTEGSTSARSITICAVQSNVPQSNKMAWTSEEEYTDFGKMVRWTVQAADWAKSHNKTIDLFVWPETMCPGYAFTDESRMKVAEFERETHYSLSGISGVSGLYYDQTLSKLANLLQTPIIVGASVSEGLNPTVVDEKTDADGRKSARIMPNRNRVFNSAIMYNADGTPSQTRYDKIKLTPFGEEMPYIHYWPWLQQKLLTLGAKGMKFNLSKGNKPVRFSFTTTHNNNQNNTIRVTTPICFESSVASVCRELVGADVIKNNKPDRADILINITNDGWFGSAHGGRLQHFQIGRFRAIENRVPVVRAANTGISGAIDSAGRILQEGPNLPPNATPAWSEGAMIATVLIDGRWTLFSIVGNLFAWLMMGLTIALTALSFSRKTGHTGKQDHA